MSAEQQVLLYALGGIVVILLVLVAFLLGRRSRVTAPEKLALPPGAEALAPAFAELRGQIAQVQERVQTLGASAQVEASRRGLEEQAWQAIQRVETAIATLGQVPDVQQRLQSQVADALQTLTLINGMQERRLAQENEAHTALQRLSAVLLGSATAGATGERVVQEALAHLPPQWIVTNHQVGGKRVEFAIKLPDNLYLPVDSKVVAQSKLDALTRATDERERERISGGIVAEVEGRVAEVRQYVDERTPGFALAAIPDAAYSLCGAILPDAFQKHHALIIPYSLLGPFILMVYEQHRRTAGDMDSVLLARAIAATEAHLERAQAELNGRLSDALTRLTNGRDALRAELAAAAQALAQARAAGDGANR
jgi:hypothetical protein